MKKRILVVDDEADITCVVRLNLESEGQYEVREVNDAAQAMAAAKEFHADLVLLDIMMPGIDGSELAAMFLNDAELRSTPLVFLTALVDRREVAPDRGWFMSQGGRTFLPKPLDFDQLKECIEEKLRHG